jgi:tRNA dimethylallyltransferase
MVVIVGPTASGKTALSLDIARKFDGEIICSDSRTIYKGMDIGTAKPTPQEQNGIPHYLLDVVEPNQTLTVAEFKRLAVRAIEDISGRGKLPIMVGGSGLYADSVTFDYQFPPQANIAQRAELDALGNDELVTRLSDVDPEAMQRVDLANRRRVIRAIETAGVGKSRRENIRANTLMLGIRLNKEVIQDRIERRIQIMLEEGFIDEVRRVSKRYGWECEALSGIGYRAFRGVVEGTKPVEVGMAELAHDHYLLAKRQMTWFKRNPAIRWLDDPHEGVRLVSEFLNEAV